MSNEQIVARALETNSYTAATAGSTINPTLYVRQIEDFAKAATVVAPLGVQFNELLGTPGQSLVIAFSSEITAATLTESTAMTPASFSYTNRTFTPSEKGVAVALTRKERIRSINDIMTEKARDMGYALAKYKDQLILALLVSSAGNSTSVNSKAVASILSSDVMDTSAIAEGVSKLREDNYNGKYIVIHPNHEKALIKNNQFVDASVYGGREVVLNGEIGRYLGMRVLVTSLVPTAVNASVRAALILDDRAFGIANKMGIEMDTFYKVLEREFILTAVEDYDVQILDTNRTCTVYAWGL